MKRLAAILGLVASALLLAPPSAEAAGDAAEKFLAAFRAKDEARMREIAEKPSVSPHLSADALLALHEEAALAEPPRPSDALDAAIALAERAGSRADSATLPLLVAAWRSMDREDLARSRRLRRVLAELPESVDRATGEAVLARVRVLESDLGTAGASMPAAWIRSREALALNALGRADDAIAANRQAIAHSEVLGWPRGASSAFRAIGWIESNRSRYREAALAYERALELSERFGTRRDHATDLTDLSMVLVSMGRRADALPHAERALEEQKALGSHPGIARALMILSSIRSEFGDRTAARDLLDRAREHSLAAGDRRMVARASLAAAHATRRLGDLESARVRFEEALADGKAVGDTRLWTEAEAEWGGTLVALGREEEGMEALRGAASRSQGLGWQTEALAWTLLAEGIAREDFEEALRARAHVVRVLEEAGIRTPQTASAYEKLSELQSALGRDAEAIASARNGLAISRELSNRLGEGFGASQQNSARRAADRGAIASLDLWRHDPAARERATREAFFFGEASRALLLASAAAGEDALPEEPAETVALRLRVREARRRVLSLAFGGPPGDGGASERGAPGSGGSTSVGVLDHGALDEARRSLEEASGVLREALARDDLARRREAPPILDPVSVQEVAASLPEEGLLVLYQQVVTRAWLVAVSRRGARLLDLGDARTYDAAAKAWAETLSYPDGQEGPHAEVLYDALLAPLEAFLPEGGRLFLGLDGPLSFLPFEAMVRHRDGRRQRAIERWTISYVTSASLHVARMRQPSAAPHDAVIALGDPVYPAESLSATRSPGGQGSRGLTNLDRLPATGDEVRDVAARFPEDGRVLLVREEATRARLESALRAFAPRLRVLHLAGHGFVDATDPMQSGMVLSGLDVMTVGDVARWHVPADLVVLTACESGRGAVKRGEGTIGFARAFLGAGARHVLVATQRVSDEQTRDVMRDFYDSLLRDGLDPAESLAAAKRARIRAGGPAAHPYAWSALVLWE